MTPSTLLVAETEKLCEYLINNSSLPEKEIELFYEFCYQTLLKARIREDMDLIQEYIKDVNLAFQGMVFGND